jgi:Protein of unknown function (DUF4199)
METPNEVSITTRSVGMKYGMFMAAFSIVSFLAFTLSGTNVTEGVGAWVSRSASTLATIVILVLAHGNFKQNGNGFMSYGQGFGISFWAVLIGIVITNAFTYVYIKFIDGTFIEMIKDQQIKAMQEKGMSDDQIENAMRIASMFMSPEAIVIIGIIFGLIFGLIIGLLVTIFTQKNNPDAIPS